MKLDLEGFPSRVEVSEIVGEYGRSCILGSVNLIVLEQEIDWRRRPTSDYFKPFLLTVSPWTDESLNHGF